MDIKLTDIRTDYIENCRSDFDIDDLTSSIEATGQQVPVGVVDLANGTYGLVYGFRRYAAVTALGLDTISCRIIEEMDHSNLLVINLQENITRQNLTYIEEAQAIQRIIDAGIDLKEFAKKVGWTKTRITQRLGLLSLPEPIKESLQEQKITVRQATMISEAPVEIMGSLLDDAENGSTIKHIKEQIDLFLNISMDEEDLGIDLVGEVDSDVDFNDDEQEEKDLMDFLEKSEVDVYSFSNMIKSFLLDLGSKSIKDDEDFEAYEASIRSVDFSSMKQEDLVSLADATSTLEVSNKTFGSYERRQNELK